MTAELHDMLASGDIHWYGNAGAFHYALNTKGLDELLRQNMTHAQEHGDGAMKLKFEVLLVNECCGHTKSINGLTTVLHKDIDAPLEGAYWWFNHAIENIRGTEVIAIRFHETNPQEVLNNE
jgi:hypothetical protein